MRRHVHPVWGLNAALVAAAVVAAALLGADTAAYVGSPHVPWIAVAVAFAVAERCVVHLRVGRSSQTFTFADAPFVVGLLFVEPRMLLASTVAALALLLIGERDLPAVKRVFNVAQYALAASLAIALFRALAPEGATATDPGAWLSAVVALQCSGVLSAMLIAAAIAVTDGRVGAGTVTEMLALDGVVTLANTTIGLTAAVLLAAQPLALVLLVVPAATVVLGYRSYIVQRRRDAALDLLHQTTRALSRSSEVTSSIERLLAQCLRAFRADLAEIVLFTDEGPLSTTMTPAGRSAVMAPLPREGELALADFAARGMPGARVEDDALPSHLARHGMRTATLALLRADDRPLGVLAVARVSGVQAAFGEDDVRTLEALAASASVALQNDHREQAVAQLTALKAKLEHDAYHDALTGLPNRRCLLEELGARTTLDPAAHALLYVDVDDFKLVNDEHGHEAGDCVLVSLARRLRGCVRPTDVVARLGGDEFVVLLEADADPVHDGRAIADRILDAVEQPIAIDGRAVRVSVSVGVATAASAEDARDLLRRADMAMYTAKRGGKRRFRVAAPLAAAPAAGGA